MNRFFLKRREIGKVIEIQRRTFYGSDKKTEEFRPVINSREEYYTYYNESSGMVLVPDSTWPIIYRYDEPQLVSVKATSPESMSAAGKKTAEILNESIVSATGDIKYKARDMMEKGKRLLARLVKAQSQLLWIASISLLVGGIGVMNIMLVSVTERTGEIGQKIMTIKTKQEEFGSQFLTEAAVLTSIGGILGVFAGVILSAVIAKMSGAPMVISVPAAVLAVVFSTVVV